MVRRLQSVSPLYCGDPPCELLQEWDDAQPQLGIQRTELTGRCPHHSATRLPNALLAIAAIEQESIRMNDIHRVIRAEFVAAIPDAEIVGGLRWTRTDGALAFEVDLPGRSKARLRTAVGARATVR